MKRALVVCDIEKAAEFYKDFFKRHGFGTVTVTADPSASRRLISEDDFDICLIHAPVARKNGIELAKDIAEKGTMQVLLCIKAQHGEETASDVLPYGIITVERPIHKQLFYNALLFSEAANERMRLARKKIAELEKRLKEQSTIFRAKCILIERKSLSEDEAHKYIEKHAMNAQTSRLEIAKEIIEYYTE